MGNGGFDQPRSSSLHTGAWQTNDYVHTWPYLPEYVDTRPACFLQREHEQSVFSFEIGLHLCCIVHMVSLCLVGKHVPGQPVFSCAQWPSVSCSVNTCMASLCSVEKQGRLGQPMICMQPSLEHASSSGQFFATPALGNLASESGAPCHGASTISGMSGMRHGQQSNPQVQFGQRAQWYENGQQDSGQNDQEVQLGQPERCPLELCPPIEAAQIAWSSPSQVADGMAAC